MVLISWNTVPKNLYN